MFCGCGSHRDLHSFPTRRSSDLRISLRCASMRRKIALNSPGIWGMSAKMAPQFVSCFSPGLQARNRIQTGERSEEHTSELQSRRDLVCRLLLEKKNNGDEHRPGV